MIVHKYLVVWWRSGLYLGGVLSIVRLQILATPFRFRHQAGGVEDLSFVHAGPTLISGWHRIAYAGTTNRHEHGTR